MRTCCPLIAIRNFIADARKEIRAANRAGCGSSANPKTKYRGIVRIASELGVTRQHAYLVAEGKRHSPRVTRALRKLKEAV